MIFCTKVREKATETFPTEVCGAALQMKLQLKEADVIGQKRGGKQRNSGTRQVDSQIERYVKSLLAIKQLERPFTNL